MARFVENSIDFSSYLKMTEESCQNVFHSGDYVDDCIDYFHGDEKDRGAELPWIKVGNRIRIRPGEVSIWLGMNGHGKSLALGQLCLGLHRQKQKLCIASLEMKPHVTLARMWRQAAMTNCPSKELIQRFHSETDSTICLYDQQGSVQSDTILGVMRYCADVEGCKHFILDSFMKCGIGEDDYNLQKRFIDLICTTARDTGMHIHVVCHSRKRESEKVMLGKMDIKGTGAISDQVDNVFTWWRNKGKEDRMRDGDSNDTEPDALLTCDKQRNGEWEGKIKFWFDPKSLQFCETQLRVPVDIFGING